jgi:hypothetical protein
MSELIKPDEEAGVRLLVFGAALVAIASRENTLTRNDKEELAQYEWVTAEARAIAQAVIDEARRLEAEKP